jgi:molybdate transport system substrate-binding protein
MFATAGYAAELKILCANGMQTVIEDLGPKFERAMGHKLAITFDTGGSTIKRARGELADVVIAIREGIAGLAKDGRVATDSVAAIASTGISVAVRKGAPKPDIGSPETFKRTLLSAKSVTYLNPADGGASGIHFAKVLDRLGIANDMKSKTVFAAKASAIGPMIANGEAELGVLQYQLLYGVPGIEIIGPLPGDLQSTKVFSAAVMTTSSNAEAAKDLISFLRAAEAAAVIKTKGMEPAIR